MEIMEKHFLYWFKLIKYLFYSCSKLCAFASLRDEFISL